MMKFLRFSSLVLLLAAGAAARAAESASTLQPANDILEHFVDWLQWRIFPDGAHSDLIHWIACGGLFLAAILLRRVVANIIFRGLKKLSEKTETTLDDKLYPALEQPVAAFIMVLGIFGALTVLQLSPAVDALISHGAIIAILAVVFWGLVRAGGFIGGKPAGTASSTSCNCLIPTWRHSAGRRRANPPLSYHRALPMARSYAAPAVR